MGINDSPVGEADEIVAVATHTVKKVNLSNIDAPGTMLPHQQAISPELNY